MTIIYGGSPPKPPSPPKEAPPAPTEATLEIVVSNKFEMCKHQKLLIDAKLRTVECRLCHAIVDPFDALVTVSEEGSRITQDIDWRKRANAKLAEEEVHLKAIVSKCKSELKKLGIPYCIAHLNDPKQMAQWSGLPVDTLQRAKAYDERFPTSKPKAKLSAIRGGKAKP
jgi:hypothetical protein